MFSSSPPRLPRNPPKPAGLNVKIDGRESLLRCVELFLNRENVKQVQIVVDADSADEFKRKFATHLGLMGVKLITATGPKWIDQLIASKDKISPDCTHVIIHDAARPAVPYTDIDCLMECAEKSPVAMLVAPVRNQLIEVDEGGHPVAYHLPTEFMNLLTPQAFSKEKFAVLAAGKEIHASEAKLVKGSPLNQRVGSSGDERIAKAMINMLPKPKVRAPDNPFEEAQW